MLTMGSLTTLHTAGRILRLGVTSARMSRQLQPPSTPESVPTPTALRPFSFDSRNGVKLMQGRPPRNPARIATGWLDWKAVNLHVERQGQLGPAAFDIGRSKRHLTMLQTLR